MGFKIHGTRIQVRQSVSMNWDLRIKLRNLGPGIRFGELRFWNEGPEIRVLELGSINWGTGTRALELWSGNLCSGELRSENLGLRI